MRCLESINMEIGPIFKILSFPFERFVFLLLSYPIPLPEFRGPDAGVHGLADALLRGVLHLRVPQRGHLRALPPLLRGGPAGAPAPGPGTHQRQLLHTSASTHLPGE